MSIKFEPIALQQNRELEMTGFPVIDPGYANYEMADNRLHWKYYQNLAGEYHFTDKVKLMMQYGHPFMQVTIPDEYGNPVLTDFTYNFLHGDINNSSFGNEYRYGSVYYNDLVRKYPEFESLILGILSPVDIQIALDAKDGEILQIDNLIKNHHVLGEIYFGELSNSYIVGRSLIEPQEHNLVDKIQSFIYTFLARWFNADYMKTDELYLTALLGIMFTQLPNLIHNIRLSNCRTTYVHSFHIYEYFASHGKLDNAVRKLSLPTALYLYRNFAFLEANSGKQLVLDRLIENAFTPEGVPLAGYIARHDISEMPDNYLPRAELLRENLNIASVGRSNDEKTVSATVNKEIPLARMNGRDLDVVIPKIEETIEWGGDDRLYTKLLESELIDIPPPYSVTYTDMLMNNWAYHVSVNNTKVQYHGVVYFTHPITLDRLAVTPLNAYRLVMYCYNLAFAGIKLVRPLLGKLSTANWIPKRDYYTPSPAHKPKYSINDYLKKVDVNQVSLTALDLIKFKAETVDIITSPGQFNQVVTSYYDDYKRQCHTMYKVLDSQARGYLESCQHDDYWHNVVCDFSFDNPAMTYTRWLSEIGVDLSQCTDEDLFDIIVELIQACLVYNFDLASVKIDKQRALIEILKHFASYTVQVLKSVGSTTTIGAGYPVLRYTRVEQKFNTLSGLGIEMSLDMMAEQYLRVSTQNRDFSGNKMVVGASKLYLHNRLDSDLFRLRNMTYTEKHRYDMGGHGVMGMRLTKK